MLTPAELEEAIPAIIVGPLRRANALKMLGEIECLTQTLRAEIREQMGETK